MATGLIRIGEAAARIHDGSARRTVAHATSGPCLQHNLVCVLEAGDVVDAADAAEADVREADVREADVREADVREAGVN
jgi:hypothetical protein